jgi:hypothetical protein
MVEELRSIEEVAGGGGIGDVRRRGGKSIVVVADSRRAVGADRGARHRRSGRRPRVDGGRGGEK